jgi:hypothetical protein
LIQTFSVSENLADTMLPIINTKATKFIPLSWSERNLLKRHHVSQCNENLSWLWKVFSLEQSVYIKKVKTFEVRVSLQRDTIGKFELVYMKTSLGRQECL